MEAMEQGIAGGGGGLRSSASLEAEAMEEGILQARRRESLAAAETLQRAWRGHATPGR